MLWQMAEVSLDRAGIEAEAYADDQKCSTDQPWPRKGKPAAAN
jgi:hypothetical protein